jgi:hypothetical protein
MGCDKNTVEEEVLNFPSHYIRNIFYQLLMDSCGVPYVTKYFQLISHVVKKEDCLRDRKGLGGYGLLLMCLIS